MDDRTRVVLTDLAIGISSLLFYLRLLRGVRNGHNRADVDVRSVVIGAAETFCYRYLGEHEPVASRLERWPGELAFTLCLVGSGRLVSRFVPSEDSSEIGSYAGFLLYRFVFGVVFDLSRGTLASMVVSVAVIGIVASRDLDSSGRRLTGPSSGDRSRRVQDEGLLGRLRRDPVWNPIRRSSTITSTSTR